MKYTIKKLAEMTGVTTRTLRYYDDINLLKPSEVNENNYRIYDEKNVNKLQQILFYRSLNFPLQEIKKIMDDPNFSRIAALKKQKQLLLKEQAKINTLLTNIDLTIKDYQGELKMTDTEKLEAFKKTKISENETKYGTEIRQRYGSETIKESNQKYSQLSEESYHQMQEIEESLIKNLIEFNKNPDMKSPLAKSIYQEHKQWLEYTWPKYTKVAHRGLVDMYISDTRFGDYYNQKANMPIIQLLHDVVYEYTK